MLSKRSTNPRYMEVLLTHIWIILYYSETFLMLLLSNNVSYTCRWKLLQKLSSWWQYFSRTGLCLISCHTTASSSGGDLYHNRHFTGITALLVLCYSCNTEPTRVRSVLITAPQAWGSVTPPQGVCRSVGLHVHLC